MDPELGAMDDAGDDPWLALVRARRLQRAGAFAAAVAAFRDAEGLLDDSEFRRRCGEERAVPRVWLADATIPDQPGPDAASPRAVAQAVRAATRRVPSPDRLPSAAAGRRSRPAAGGRSWTPRPGRSPTSSPARSPEQLYADLARVGGGDRRRRRTATSVATLEQIILTAEVEEQPWLARVARGVQAAVLLVTSRRAVAGGVVRVPGRGVRSASGTHGASCSSPVHSAWLTPCAATVRPTGGSTARPTPARGLLDAPVLAAWAEAVAAFAARRARGRPTPSSAGRQARALARTAGVVGAGPVLVGSHARRGADRPEPPAGP